jgi:hypothetical protein
MTVKQDVGKVEGEYNRPRRPDADTIAYLRSLPLDLHAAFDQITVFLAQPNDTEETVEYPHMLAAALSAIDEIRNEIASLAGDEVAAEAIEVLAHIAGPHSEIAIRKLLFGTTGYALHLSTHRYGSHVLQTILELAATSHSEIDLASHREAPPLDLVNEELPSLAELLLQIVEEIVPFTDDLAIHICGSHVLRSLVCILGGVKVVQQPGSFGSQGPIRRGKVKPKRKKSKSAAPYAKESSQSNLHQYLKYISNSRVSTSDERIRNSLEQLVSAISGNQVREPGDLQHLACNASASPLLIVILRVLTYSAAVGECKTKARNLEESGLERRVDHHLSILQPEPKFVAGSQAHNLAKRLLCWQDSTSEQKWAPDVIYGLSGETRGSHILETVLRLSSDEFFESILEVGGFLSKQSLQEFVEHDVSNFVIQTALATIRNEKQAEKFLEVVAPLVVNGYVIRGSNRRRGILWRLTEMAARFPGIQKATLKVIREGFVIAGEVQSKSNGLVGCVPKLLNMKKAEETGGHLTLDVAGTRTLFHLLRFEAKYCEEVLLGIADKLEQDDLELLAKDGLGSRCIWDGVLEGPVQEAHFSTALKRILKKLQGRWVGLAADRVGHHSVIKLFRRLVDMGDREKLVVELSEGMHRLTGNSMGRNVLDVCSVREYNEVGYSEWSSIVKKQLQREQWLKDMVEKDLADRAPKKKRDRKRKRLDRDATDKRAQSKGDLSVDTIMDTFSIPTRIEKE